jgi:hypothetical protein
VGVVALEHALHSHHGARGGLWELFKELITDGHQSTLCDDDDDDGGGGGGGGGGDDDDDDDDGGGGGGKNDGEEQSDVLVPSCGCTARSL